MCKYSKPPDNATYRISEREKEAGKKETGKEVQYAHGMMMVTCYNVGSYVGESKLCVIVYYCMDHEILFLTNKIYGGYH